MPLLTVFGWQKPCYLLGEGYAKTFAELMEGTEWQKYGVGNYEKCANCMVHCGFEGSAVKDSTRNPLQILPILMRGVKTDGPMAPGYRPVKTAAGGIHLRPPCRAQDVRDPDRQVQHHRGRGSGVVPRRPCSRPAPVRISAGICSGFFATDHSTRPSAMPPSGVIATSAAGGRAWEASSEITRSAASLSPRAAAKRAATWLSISTAKRAAGIVKRGFGRGCPAG